jgi:hypothetical protein
MIRRVIHGEAGNFFPASFVYVSLFFGFSTAFDSTLKLFVSAVVVGSEQATRENRES